MLNCLSLYAANVQEARVFMTSDGGKVVLVTLDKQNTLIKFQNISSQINDKTLPYKKVDQGKRTNYILRHQKTKQINLYSVQQYGNTSFYLLTEKRKSQKLYFSNKESAKFKSTDILDSYLFKRASALNEAKFLKSIHNEMSSTQKKIKVKCGKTIKVSLDNKSFKSSFIRKFAVEKSCGQTITGLTSLCDDDDAKEELVKRVNSIRCVQGKDSKIELSGKDLLVQFSGNDTGAMALQLNKYLWKNL